MRLWAVSLLLAATACASSTRDPLAAMRASCEADPASDPRCVEILTTASDGLEAEEMVKAAESERQAVAFDQRLARMRRDEEARAAIRTTRTSTVARLAPPDREEIPELEGVVQEAATVEDSGSSVRALTVGPPPKAPEVVPAPVPQRVAPAELAPTPEAHLRGATCVLDADRVRLRAALKKRDTSGRIPPALAPLALVLVSADALAGRVQAEVEHRKLAKVGPLCSSSELKAVVGRLRTLLGPYPEQPEAADPYGRGLIQLEKELEVRAGLPRSQ